MIDGIPGITLGNAAQRVPHVQRGWGSTGCYLHSNNWIYYNPGPGQNLHNFRPICGPNGGRAAELITPMAGTNNLPYDFVGGMPSKVELSTAGTRCDECGVLNYDQCQKAGRDLAAELGVNAVQGNDKRGPIVQFNPGLSGCYKYTNNYIYFNPGTPGNPLEDYGPAKGMATIAAGRSICGACTTTTTPAPEPAVEPAAEPEVEETDENQPWLNQGKYELLGAGSQCPDDQILTLAQCSGASWPGATYVGAVPDINPGLQTYGAMASVPSAGSAVRGCYYATNRGVYWNGEPTGTPNPLHKPICAASGGRLAEKQEEAALPAGGVEKHPLNTVCDDCGVLSVDQCKLAGESLGITPAKNSEYGNWPIYKSNRNATKLGGPGPRGCYYIPANGYLYFNFDPVVFPDNSRPHAVKQPICGVCDTTTTTTPAPEEIEPPAPGDDDDAAEAVGDPHITTNEGEHFDMQE